MARNKSPDDELVTIATFNHPIDAQMAKGALEAAGISAFVPDGNFGAFSPTPRSGVYPIFSAFDLKVLASDRDRAIEILETLAHPVE
jgi:hypothetical protein